MSGTDRLFALTNGYELDPSYQLYKRPVLFMVNSMNNGAGDLTSQVYFPVLESTGADIIIDTTQTATIRVYDEPSFASVSNVLGDESSTIYNGLLRDFKPLTHTVEVKVGQSIDVDFESAFQFGAGDTLDTFY